MCAPSEAGCYGLVGKGDRQLPALCRSETLLTVSVTRHLSVGTFGALPNTTDVGRPLEFEATPLHGVPSLQWTYFRSPTGCGSVSLENFSCTDGFGPFTASVTVTDSTREKAASNTSLFVNPAPAVNASIAPGSVTLHGAFLCESSSRLPGARPFTASVGPDPAAACTATNGLSIRLHCRN